MCMSKAAGQAELDDTILVLMQHLPFAISAYFLNSIAVLVDKFLLTKQIKNPLIYIFYFSVYSSVFILAVPFIHLPNSQVIALASLSTLAWASGAYFMFSVLQIGQASRVIPVIGTLIPLILLIFALGNHTVNQTQILAVLSLVLGLIFLSMPYLQGEFMLKEIYCEVLAAILFALSYLLIREAYLRDTFIPVFVWSRLIFIPIGLGIFSFPKIRRIILGKHREAPKFSIFSKSGLLFITGQACGGGAELLLSFSIFLANPVVVNSLQGVQYVFLFIFSLILSKKFPQVYKESLSKLILLGKVVGISFIGYGLYLLATGG